MQIDEYQLESYVALKLQMVQRTNSQDSYQIKLSGTGWYRNKPTPKILQRGDIH